MVVSSRRQTNVDKAVLLLRSKNIQVIGTTCNVGKAEDREKLINMVRRFFFFLSNIFRELCAERSKPPKKFKKICKCIIYFGNKC